MVVEPGWLLSNDKFLGNFCFPANRPKFELLRYYFLVGDSGEIFLDYLYLVVATFEDQL